MSRNIPSLERQIKLKANNIIRSIQETLYVQAYSKRVQQTDMKESVYLPKEDSSIHAQLHISESQGRDFNIISESQEKRGCSILAAYRNILIN